MSSIWLRRFLFLGGLSFLGWSFILLEQSDNPSHAISENTNGYAGDAACQSCHAEAFNAWQGSHHDHAMKVPNSQSVRGNFNNTYFQDDGVTYHFYQNDSAYLVQITEDGKSAKTYPIAYTFGWEPLQQYLVYIGKGKYQTLRASWDTEQNTWFHQYPDTLIAENDWLHWTGAAQNWNSMCAACHSTHIQKNYIAETDSFHTIYDIINVSCESCHGPGKAHIAAMNNPDKSEQTFIQVYSKENHQEQVNMCGACHGLRTQLTDNSNPTAHFLQQFSPDLLHREMFHADGQQMGEVYNYASFLSSKMYLHRVSCTDCHDPHTARIKLDGNALCLQCHQAAYNTPSHHFHKQESSGASCVSCHMPGSTYMVNDYRHDHSFRVPRPDQSVIYGTPNTCTQCHENQTDEWAAIQVSNWYGKTRKWHFSDALLQLGNGTEKDQIEALQALMEKDSVPDIVRATAVSWLPLFSHPSATTWYLNSFRDPSPLVRLSAFNSLLGSTLNRNQSLFREGLKDTVLAVRLAAYRSTADLPSTDLNEAEKNDRSRAESDYRFFLENNEDMVNGLVLWSEYYQQKGNIPAAVDAYLRALIKDKMAAEVRLNLAILYSRMNEPQAAKAQLLSFIQYYPKHHRAHYYLSLVYSQLNDYANAIKEIEIAIQLENDMPVYAYNYILMLDKAGRKAEAKSVLQKAIQQFPDNAALQSLIPYFQ